MLELTRWLAAYYGSTWGQALDAAVPAGVKKQAGTRVWTCLTVPESTRSGMLEGSWRYFSLISSGYAWAALRSCAFVAVERDVFAGVRVM